MPTTLTLTDGTTTVDFITSTSDYKLRQNGLGLPIPQLQRITGSISPLYEGERLVDRQHGNREISIVFNINATSHDALVSDIRTIDRLIETAKKSAREGFGPKVSLNYKLDNATDQMVFDILDGELKLDLGTVLVRRDSHVLDAELLFICQPYARLASPIELSNYLLNPSFDWNPGEQGRDAGYHLDFGATGIRLEHATPTNFSPTSTPPIMSMGCWVNPDSIPAGAVVGRIVRCGQTTVSFNLEIVSTGAIQFTWRDGSVRSIASTTILSVGTWYFIGVTVFTIDNVGVYTVLTINDIVEGTLFVASPAAMDSPVGVFSVGADSDDTDRFDGKIAGLFIIKHMNILPYQLAYIYRYGMRGLHSESVLSPKYWGLQSGDFGGVYPFDEAAGSILDKSGNARDLTVVGAPARTVNIPKPKAWTMGANFSASTVSGISSAQKKQGNYSLLFNEAGAATLSVEQTVSIPAGNATILIYLRANAGSAAIELDWDGVVETITPTPINEWRQFIKTKAVTGGTSIVKLKRLSGTTNIHIDLVLITEGTPFGTFASATDITATPKPFVGSRYIKSYPDATNVFWLDIDNLPGDVPATIKLHLKSTTANPLSPIRIGCISGYNPWKQVLFWRASLFGLVNAAGSVYSAGSNPTVNTSSAVTITDRFLASLPSLFPFPAEQIGPTKIFVGSEVAQNMVTLAKILSEGVAFPITGDPFKDLNAVATNIHLYDVGILAWPPEQSLTSHRSGLITSRPRIARVVVSPKLAISNISDASIATVKYHYIFALPMQNGFHVTLPPTSGNEAGLLNTEELIVDTIDEESVGVGYIQKKVTTPAGASNLVYLSSADVSQIGAGFRIPPGIPTLLTFLLSRHGQAGDLGFGRFEVGNTAEVWIEYMPRFLFV